MYTCHNSKTSFVPEEIILPNSSRVEASEEARTGTPGSHSMSSMDLEESYLGPTSNPVLGDVVALLVDIPWQNVWRGQVGRVVELTSTPASYSTTHLSQRSQRKVGVEFRDVSTGMSFQLLIIPANDVMVLHQQQHPDW